MNLLNCTTHEAICEAGRRLYDRSYVAARDGNISCRTPEGILATPSGISKGFMSPDMLLLTDLNGNLLEPSKYIPTSELKMHLMVYKLRPDVGAVVHAHPLNATVCACAGISLTKKFLPEPAMALGDVYVAPYGTPGTDEVPESIIPFCSGNAVLLANHGALTWGKDLREALYRMESLESYAALCLKLEYELHLGNELTSEQLAALGL